MSARVDVNVCSLSGNLVKDSEFKSFGNGGVLNFTIAVNESKKNQNGEYESYANFIDCSYWSKGASGLSQYLKKGSQVVVSGAIHQDRWQSQDGKSQSRLIVRVDNIKLCGGNKQGNGGNASSGNDAAYHEDIPSDCPF